MEQTCVKEKYEIHDSSTQLFTFLAFLMESPFFIRYFGVGY